MEIKKCPFCGGEARIYATSHHYSSNTWGDNWKIACIDCDFGSLHKFETKVYRDKNGELIVKQDGREEAIKAWNRRVEDEETTHY